GWRASSTRSQASFDLPAICCFSPSSCCLSLSISSRTAAESLIPSSSAICFSSCLIISTMVPQPTPATPSKCRLLSLYFIGTCAWVGSQTLPTARQRKGLSGSARESKGWKSLLGARGLLLDKKGLFTAEGFQPGQQLAIRLDGPGFARPEPRPEVSGTGNLEHDRVLTRVLS